MKCARLPWMVVLLLALELRAASIVPPNRRIKVTPVGTLYAPIASPMHMPTDVVVDHSGRVFVADGVNDRLVRFSPGPSTETNPSWKYEQPIVRVGTEPLSNPIGLAIDDKNRLWIADNGSHRVLIARPDGELAQTIDLPASGDKPFDVTDLTVTHDGRITYIVDNDHHRLAVRDNGSGQLHFVGRFGESLGQFRWPFMVSTGPGDDVFISEAIGARVQRMTADERWAGSIGQFGVELGQLYRPKGIVVSPRGQVFISDSTTGTVQVFTARGALSGVLTDDDGKTVSFAHPMGMAFDRIGRLYVTELKAGRIAVVQLPAEWAGVAASAPAENHP